MTKTVPPEVIREAIACGLTDLGENRVKEARAKQIALDWGLEAGGPEPRALSPQPVRWHLIGYLQRNKAKHAVELFSVIHSVESLELIEELERQAAKQASGFKLQAPSKLLEVLIQVNISGEATKFGCRPEEAAALAVAAARSAHLKLLGLMAIPPFTENPEESRAHFRRLRQLREDVAVACSRQPAALQLSMGMSNDFEVAIEEGADIVRIGTAIFGERAE